MSPDAAWAQADELRVAERSTSESNVYVLPEEATGTPQSWDAAVPGPVFRNVT